MEKKRDLPFELEVFVDTRPNLRHETVERDLDVYERSL